MDIIINSLKSKTVWGLIIAALGSTGWGSDFVLTFGLTEDSGVLFADKAITVVGLVIGYYGRVVAKKPLKDEKPSLKEVKDA